MKPDARILIVDDSPATLEVLARHLAGGGRVVTTAGGTRQALEALTRDKFDLVITDLRMPDGDGMDLVRHIRESLPDTEVMMITGYATIQGAVDAMKTGAAEYLAKPFTRHELLEAVARVMERLRSARGAPAAGRGQRFGLIGGCDGMVRAFATMEGLVGTGGNAVFVGEPGTGRSAAARAVASRARGGTPLLEASALDLGGAGAAEALLERASGGTVLLRDVTWSAPEHQEALLRALSHRGPAPTRILAVAEPELGPLTAGGAFSPRLFARLGETQVALPPLRERDQDIIRLAECFAARLPGSAERPPGGPVFAESARAALLAYAWPGNIPELRGVAAGALLGAAPRPVEASALPAAIGAAAPDALRPLAEMETAYIRRVLAAVGGNKSRAAEILGINRKTLGEKLRSGLAGKDRSGAGE